MSTKTKERTKLQTKLDQPYQLILHNDDYNDFDHVIESLVKICKHGTNQANQCAIIAHEKGQCDIKRGDLPKLSQMKLRLENAQLIVTLESVD